MPVISVNKIQLYSLLDTSFADENVEEFEDLCFAFGVEVDEIVKNEKGEITDFKIEIPANRYDLLCIEGLSMALRFFIGKEPVAFRYEAVKPAAPQQIIIKESTGQRPVVVCAVLRGVDFNPDRYDSFIQLQDKLHHNICRKRKLASIGTHDLDTISGPFEYACLPPKEINFVPLNQTASVDGNGLIELLSKHEQLSEYLSLIRDNPTYPVIHDKNRQVLSLPPIINSEHSKIKLTTKNVFIEVTAIDYTKANIVLNIMCTMFSQYCEKRFQVEQVEIIDEATKKSTFTPIYEYRDVNVDLGFLNTGIGVEIKKDLVQGYLHKMQLACAVKDTDIVVTVPPTRSDILHPCDILEDVAIGYGFNTILEKATAPKTLCHGKQQPINMLSDRLRRELAMAGFTEVLTFSLCSRKENFDYLNIKDDNVCVTIDNPQNQSFQVCRTSLYPGLLKTFKNSKKLAMPISIFEVSDIVKLDPTNDIGCSNVRALCAMVVGIVDVEFDNVHGLLDRIMEVLDILHEIQYKEWVVKREKEVKEGKVSTKVYNSYYYIKEGKNTTYLPGRCAEVRLKTDIKNNKEVSLGYLGLLHPDVATNFSISGMIAAIHLDVSVLEQVFHDSK
jgi:phenylalanyl-tRNA synthetase beta chain